MKKFLIAPIFFIVLMALIYNATFAAKTRIPVITYDPNSITESPTDPNNVTITIQMEITKEQYAAMQYLDISFDNVIHRSRLSRNLDRLIVQAKARMTAGVDVNDLKTKMENE